MTTAARQQRLSRPSRLPRVEYQEVWSGNQTKLSPCLQLNPAPAPARVSRKRLQFRLLCLDSWLVFLVGEGGKGAFFGASLTN